MEIVYRLLRFENNRPNSVAKLQKAFSISTPACIYFNAVFPLMPLPAIFSFFSVLITINTFLITALKQRQHYLLRI